MHLSQLLTILDEIAPTQAAEAWDNVGLLAGDIATVIHKAILTIDLTPNVLAEAIEKKCELVIAYHPPLFDPIKRIDASSVLFQAIRNNVAIYSPHTALDVAEGGTNDVLADLVQMRDRRALRPAPGHKAEVKLVTFAPFDAVEKMSDALFAAGAGRIGNYSRCSFRSPGEGTFFGEEGATPAAGEAGKFERVPEIRVETLVSRENLTNVIAALKKAHPYETPAYDLLTLTQPVTASGLGRIGTVEPMQRSALIANIGRALRQDHLLVAGPTGGEARTVVVCAGSCGDLMNDAIREGADLLLTGEVRHHDALRAAGHGMTVVCTLHSNSERVALPHYQRMIAKATPDVDIRLSEIDRDPFVIV